MPIRSVLAALALCVSGPALCLDAPMGAQQPAFHEASRRSYGQNYADIALALCVAQAYASEPRANPDAIASAGGIDQWSNFDLEAGHDAIAALITRYLARDYPSFQGPETRLDMMKCLDLYHSEELAAQIRRFVPTPSRSYEKDHPPEKP